MTTVKRAPITAELLSALEPVAADAPAVWVVDIAIRPDGGGWQGDPYESDYVPYAVLTPMAAEVSASVLTSGFSSAVPIELPYGVTNVGVTVAQVEALADITRHHWDAVVGVVPAGQPLEITSVLPSRIGAVQRIDHDHGPYYVQTDVVIARVSP